MLCISLAADKASLQVCGCRQSCNFQVITWDSNLLYPPFCCYKEPWTSFLTTSGVLSVTLNWCNNKEFLCITHTVEHSYICFGPICGPSSGCDLTYRPAIQEYVGCSLRVLGLGGGGGNRDLVLIVGSMT